tara:strand:- start:1215 stop:2408 length:1194 start_codon:yes stop_codon:yes gene_type:complete
MATHDYDIANQSGASFRADLNNALAAIVSQNSSSTEPATKFAYQYWVDTSVTPALIKQRNSANNAWITLAEVDGQLLAADGTLSKPGISFSSDTDSGLRRNSDDTLSIVTNGSNRLTVSSSGSIGIGTTSPNGDLHIQDTGNASLQLTAGNTSLATIRFGDTDDANIGKIEYNNTDNKLEFDTNSSTRLTILSDGKCGIGETTPTERLHVSGNIKATSDIFIGTDSTAPHAEAGTTTRLRLQQDQVSVAANQNGALKVSRLGNDGNAAQFFRSGTEVGNISVTGSATAYNTSSDYRLKENIVNLEDGITRVKQLLPKRFNFIGYVETTVDGFVAHEAQAVVPEAVTGTHNEVDENGNPVMQGIDQAKLVPLLTAALQEAIVKIETLETKVAALEAAN